MTDAGPLNAEEICRGLITRRIPSRVLVMDSATSSNDVAWEHVGRGSADGLAVFAEHQAAGRGRLGRVWHSPRGAGVLCSVVLDDAAGVLKGGLMGLVCGVAACDAVRAATHVPVELSWPNDLMARGRKLGGILVESRPGAGGGRVFVAGIGINCLQHRGHFPPELRKRATSLDLESCHPIDRTRVARALLQQLDAWLVDPRALRPEVVCERWRARAVGLGQPIRLRRDGREYAGVVVDVDPTSALVVQLDQGPRMLFDAEGTTVLDA